ncbi:hypothetical protein Leryth_027149 [Lithospermum erythrorhizon]|nr:hypothetical protein Leryth_027149 [Lithospermum erythrorhizon]
MPFFCSLQSHAFHMNCIDTWMLSNSTCPLCRQLISSGIALDNTVFNNDELRDQLNVLSRNSAIEVSTSHMDGNFGVEAGEMRVLSVRLGKFRNVNIGERRELDQGETSSSINLDARRCYSMGTFQYVVGESELQVALSSNDIGAGSFRFTKTGHDHGGNNADREAKKINARTRGGDSFSVSKIWLWSKRSKFPSLADTNRRLTPLDIL